MEQQKENDMSIWIQTDTTIGRNAKVLRMARNLKISKSQLIGHLILLWTSTLEQREDGDISKWTDDDIEYYAEWEGQRGRLVKAMKEEDHRFLDEKNGLILIHDWLQTAGRYLERKYGGKKESRDKLKTIYEKHGVAIGGEGEEPPTKTNILLPEDSLEIKISKFLFDKIKANDPNAKEPNFQSWAKYIDGLLRLDKRTKEEIGEVILWSQANSFWKTNILSTKKLRDKFPTLLLQMNEKPNGKSKHKFDSKKFPTLKESQTA